MPAKTLSRSSWPPGLAVKTGLVIGGLTVGGLCACLLLGAIVLIRAGIASRSNSAVDAPAAELDIGRLTISQKLQVAVIGLNAHETALGRLPPNQPGEKGSGLSWRVHILPYIGEVELYQKFNQDQPWNGPDNIQLLSAIPRCFDTGDGAKTRVRGFACLLGPGGIVHLWDAKGKSSEAVLTIGVGASLATEWTKPEDLGSTPADIEGLVQSLEGEPVVLVLGGGMPLQMPTQLAIDNLPRMVGRADSRQTGRSFADSDGLDEVNVTVLRYQHKLDLPIDTRLRMEFRPNRASQSANSK